MTRGGKAEISRIDRWTIQQRAPAMPTRAFSVRGTAFASIHPQREVFRRDLLHPAQEGRFAAYFDRFRSLK
jgi:hypothetical protein